MRDDALRDHLVRAQPDIDRDPSIRRCCVRSGRMRWPAMEAARKQRRSTQGSAWIDSRNVHTCQISSVVRACPHGGIPFVGRPAVTVA
jgi:hypothetical protein